MIKGYYFITDAVLSRNGNLSDVRNAIEAGVGVVQYRNKDGSTKEIYEEALALKKICKGAKFIIDDRIDIAVSVDADGVHIGDEDMPYGLAREILGKEKIIGVTVHNVEEAIEYEKRGADYLGVSPVFATTTKKDAGKPAGVELVKKVRKACKIPIVAIGGITLDNAKEIIDAGADAICAISAVVTKDDVRKEIEKFQRLFKRKD